MASIFRELLPSLCKWPGTYVQSLSFVAVVAFIDGYRWGAADDDLISFNSWLARRHPQRPELAWSWLVLCEIYPVDDLPSPRAFSERQDMEAIRLLFDLLDEFYHETR